MIIIPSNTSAALPPVSAPVIFVGSAIARGVSTLAIPAHTAGDIICANAYIATPGTTDTLGIPAGWTTARSVNSAWTGAPWSVRWNGYRTATSSGTSFGTFTNATHVCVHVFRPTGGNGGFITDWGNGAGYADYYSGFNGLGTAIPFTTGTPDPYAGAGTWGNAKVAWAAWTDRSSTITLRPGFTQSASSTWCKAAYASFGDQPMLVSPTFSPACNWAAAYWAVHSNSPAN